MCHAWLQNLRNDPRVADGKGEPTRKRKYHAWSSSSTCGLKKQTRPRVARLGHAWPRVVRRPRVAMTFFSCFLLLEAARGFQNQEKSGKKSEKGRPRVASRIKFRVHKTYFRVSKASIKTSTTCGWHRVQEGALLIWLLFIRIALYFSIQPCGSVRTLTLGLPLLSLSGRGTCRVRRRGAGGGPLFPVRSCEIPVTTPTLTHARYMPP
jgi:hypothetical protein